MTVQNVWDRQKDFRRLHATSNTIIILYYSAILVATFCANFVYLFILYSVYSVAAELDLILYVADQVDNVSDRTRR